jgi:hypothetical protein
MSPTTGRPPDTEKERSSRDAWHVLSKNVLRILIGSARVMRACAIESKSCFVPPACWNPSSRSPRSRQRSPEGHLDLGDS